MSDDHLDEQYSEATARQFARMRASLAVHRKGWTRQQWIDDAIALMDEPDGAVTSLVNGHVIALIEEVTARRQLAAVDLMDAYERGLAAGLARGAQTRR